MSNNEGLETLINLREKLIAQRDTTLEGLNKRISDVELTMELLTGKKIAEIISEERYDDENPDQVKQSLEEI